MPFALDQMMYTPLEQRAAIEGESTAIHGAGVDLPGALAEFLGGAEMDAIGGAHQIKIA
jgi:hypothetical protein